MLGRSSRGLASAHLPSRHIVPMSLREDTPFGAGSPGPPERDGRAFVAGGAGGRRPGWGSETGEVVRWKAF